MTPDYPSLAKQILESLCTDIPERPVGSAGNQQAAELIRQTFQRYGWQVGSQPFDCIDWQDGGATFEVGRIAPEVFASPFSPGCDVRAPLTAVASQADLAGQDLQGSILLLYGEIAKEQLFPRNFPYVTNDEHQEIYRLVEAARPAAVLTATAYNAQIVGGQYPCPMFEDGDFNLPSAFLSAEEGARLLAMVGQPARLTIRSVRKPSRGENVLASLPGRGQQRVVVCAHLDAKPGTPGALDNGTGIAILLLCAEMLADWQGNLGVQLIAINGEDYYSAPGEVALMTSLDGQAQEIALAINSDGVGYIHGHTAFSMYECPDDLAEVVRKTMHAVPGIVEGEPWPQSDHMVFAMQGIPAVALTSDAMWEMVSQVTHTAKDRLELVDVHKVVRAAAAVCSLMRTLGSDHLG